MAEPDTAALVETVLLFAGKNVAPELRGAVAALAQRLADAERVVAAADHSAIPARDFLVREWRDKAEEYRVERDAAEARASRAEAALRKIEETGHPRDRRIARAAFTSTEEPEPGSPEYEAQTDAFLHAIGVEEPEQQ